MEKPEYFQVVQEEAGIRLTATVLPTAEGLTVTLYGGDKPHVGAVALALPRPSLQNPTQVSATVSNLTIVGHKDDEIAKPMAEELAKKLEEPVVVVAGVHLVAPTPAEINTVTALVPKMVEAILARFPY